MKKPVDFHELIRVIRHWMSRNMLKREYPHLREASDLNREIRESELRYRALIEAIPDAIVVHSEGKIVFANPAAAEMFRAPNIDAMSGQAVMDFVDPSERAAVARRIQTLLRKQRPVPMADEKLQRLDGEIFHAEVHAIPVDYLGKPAIQVIVHDISERKKIEGALKNMASFAEYNPGPVLRVNENGKVLNVNPAANKILDNGIVGNPIAQAVPPLKEMDIGKLIALGKVARCEYRFGDKWFKFTVRGVPELGVAHVYGTDITERKQAENTLKESEEKFRSLTEQSPNMIFINQNGRVVFANTQCKKTMGYSIGELYAPDFDFRSLIAPEHLDLVNANFARHIQAKEVPPYECTLVTKDGKRLDTIHSTRLIHYGGGQATLGIITDITERKQAERLTLKEKYILEMLATGRPLQEVLTALNLMIESQFHGMCSSILILDNSGKHLLTGAAPSLPEAYNTSINGVAIGPNAGSCGTAAYRDETVIVNDIGTDPLWKKHKELALAHGLRACWSMPIHSSEGKVLGTFAMYSDKPRNPVEGELELIASTAHIAGVAIERKQVEGKLHEYREHLEQMVQQRTEQLA